MNAHQIWQYLGNNYIYGENRRVVSAQPLTAGLIQPDYSRVWGIDISHWDGVVDLEKSKALGCQFVIIKALDGTLPSKYFPENYATANRIGLVNSSYAWLYRDVNVRCTAQAQAYSILLQKSPPHGLPPCVDFETTFYGGKPASPNFDDLRKWVTEFLRLGNPKPLLYSGPAFMDQYGQIPSDLKAMFAGLWIANYGVSQPSLPKGWGSYVLWQFASNGDALLIAPGTNNKKELDLNYAAESITPPPPPTGGTMKYGKVVYNINLRSSAGVITSPSNDIGDLYIGDEVVSDTQSGLWWHLTDATHNGLPVMTTSGQTVKQRTDVYAASGNGTILYIQEHAAPAPNPLPDLPVSITLGDDIVYAKQTVTVTLKPK